MLVANYKTKKLLKESLGKDLLHTETSIFGKEYKTDGTFCVVGPSAYVRKWYAEVTTKDGKIIKVS
jgi:hypothetical protein